MALPFCATDQGLAKTLLAFMEELDTYLNHDLLLFRESEATAIPHPSGWRSVVTVSYTNPYQSVPSAQKRWAMSTSQAFSSVARHVEYEQQQPFLFLEPDCVPIGKGWLDAIEAEYAQTKKPFMGFLVSALSDSPAHMSGIGCYPAKVVEHAGQALMLDEQWPWDLSAADAIRPKAHFTDLISHIWKRKPYTSLEEFYSENSKETVLFHSQKTPALIELLRNNLNGGVESRHAGDGEQSHVGKATVPTDSGGSAPPVQKPWSSLTPKEKKFRRQAQAAKARAAKKGFRGKILEEVPESSVALPSYTSEASTARAELAKYCVGLGVEVGSGGDCLVPHALTFDLPQPYTRVGGVKQILQGNCRDLSFFCNESLSWIGSNHLLEDFSYSDLVDIISEWRRVLKPNGLLITNCPWQQRFLAHIQKTGQPNNLAHHEQDFGLDTFKSRVLDKTGPWKVEFEKPDHGPYSFLLVVSKQ